MKKAQKTKLTLRISSDVVNYVEREANRLGFSLTHFAELLLKRGVNSWKEQRREEAHEEASYTRWVKGYYDKLG